MGQKIEKNFAWIFIASLVAAIIFADPTKYLDFLVEPILIIMLYLSFIKVDIADVFAHIRKPWLIIYLSFFYLIVIPVFIFYAFINFDKELAIGFLLLAALPPGVASPALASIAKGNTALGLTLTVLGHLIAPFSIVLLSYLLTSTILELDFLGIFYKLVIFIAIPLFLAQISKKFLKYFSKRIIKHSSAITIIALAVLTYIVVGFQAEKILANPAAVLRDLSLLFLVFAVFHVLGYFLPFWRDKRDKITSSISKTYMNSALGIVLAYKFFTPEIALILVLAEIPWLIMFIPFKYFSNRIFKSK